jgi:hypothetical protein
MPNSHPKRPKRNPLNRSKQVSTPPEPAPEPAPEVPFYEKPRPIQVDLAALYQRVSLR